MSRQRPQQESRNSSKKRKRSKYTNDRDAEIERLEERIFGEESKEEIPERGYVPPLGQKTPFKSLPLSEATLRALEEGTGGGRRNNKQNKKKQRIRKRDYASKNNRTNEDDGDGAFGEGTTEESALNGVGRPKNFTIMTDIQNACIPHALRGRDILGAAKTGSGKTLAFLIPLVERLYRSKWSPGDGVGAIVLSPTRELAMQIFDVLRLVGRYHPFSAGLVVGGKADALEEEQARLPTTNIIVATPGRLLQHLEETPLFDASTCQMLVLDEADRILDMGFRKQLHTILEYLPSSSSSGNDLATPVGVTTRQQLTGRQTLLFSATQTKDVKALAKLSLSKPEYIGVHDKESIATPEQLVQSLMVCPLEHKLDMVFSFLKSHLKHKILIFFSTCSQVRFIYELFCSLQPGISVLCLHGKIKQEKRTKIYFEFLNKPHAVLLATDVAARGLDFPNVDWVVQADSPEDRDAYIHRVGRTARNAQKGNSLLLVLPLEKEGMTNMLEQHSIPFKTLQMNPRKAVTITQRAAAIVASKPDRMIPLAKKAFSSYLRSLSLMPNKDIFGCNILKDLPLEEYATSLGLPSTPSTRFLKKLESRDTYREKKNKNYKLERLKEQIRNDKLKKRVEELSGNSKEESSNKKLAYVEDDNDDDNHNDLLVVKQKHEWSERDVTADHNGDEGQDTRKPKRIRVEGSTSGMNKKIVFDDDGNVKPSLIESATTMTQTVHDKLRDASLEKASDAFMERIKDRLSLTREQDIAEEKARIREKRIKKKRQEKGLPPSANEGDFSDDDDDNEDGNKSFDENTNHEVREGKSSYDSSSDSSSSDSSSSSDEDSEDEDSNDIAGDGKSLAEQEALALAMLQGS